MRPIYDYRKLRGLIKEHYGTLSEFAEAIGISTTSLNERLQNRVAFGQVEIDKSIELLQVDPNEMKSIFFTHE